MSKVITGIPFGWFETGTEGVIWAVQDENHINKEGFYSYEGLNCIKPGDHLKITMDGKYTIFDDEVTVLKYTDGDLSLAGNRIHWLPDNADLWQWAEVFLRHEKRGEFKAVLTKKEQK